MAKEITAMVPARPISHEKINETYAGRQEPELGHDTPKLGTSKFKAEAELALKKRKIIRRAENNKYLFFISFIF
jgi:hypothetical protein